ncbi:YeeE/YedE family protein [Salinimicrobium oceani]|uniref:YeeE/YedE family protein n=1 Tax=Salinimicrobium oceani TaxID=2722702 RepID=A0ABX1CXJ1_9FLAO|nr:YeeE/YedE thiosulfate transporter family protein [Salinimicrobium oceani]NJW51508.1 YeeE/YedE family protein [Salinimicrobium oceani]
MEFIFEPWPWYVAGPMIALVMFVLIFMGKKFGMSSNLETMCTMCGAGKKSAYFNVDWKASRWNLIVILGAAIGGFLAANVLSNNNNVKIAATTVEKLHDLGFDSAGEAYLPDNLFAIEALLDPKAVFLLLLGGILIGFGARYAAGCTSGHAISGLSNLQLPSLIAVIGFFIGGLLMVHFLFPIIF